MRLWIGPANEIIDMDEEDLGHALGVAIDPGRYGLDPAPMAAHLEAFHSGETDFDYNTVILMAEEKGWVRVTRDADVSDGCVALSAACPKAARGALRLLDERGLSFVRAQIEIENLDGDLSWHGNHVLDEEAFDRFMKKGDLPPARRHSTKIEEAALLAALEATTTAPGM